MRLYNDRCENILPTLDADSIEAMVSDPPGGIAFMGKDWDKDHGGRDNWIEYMAGIFRECLRVLKPGAHALIWGLPRTAHWTATALENAGFEIRDRITDILDANKAYGDFVNSLDDWQLKQWCLVLESLAPSSIEHIFGSGFPKSLDISKAIDKIYKKDRKIIGRKLRPDNTDRNPKIGGFESNTFSSNLNTNRAMGVISIPSTHEAQQLNGWHTGLKPAVETWILCRKPLAEKTVAANVLAYGVGGINVDGCRVGFEQEGEAEFLNKRSGSIKSTIWQTDGDRIKLQQNIQGRFPANVVLDDSEVVRAGFPNAGGHSTGKNGIAKKAYNHDNKIYSKGVSDNHIPFDYQDSGSAARFFYCAKASKKDRDEGLEGFEEKIQKRTQSGGDDTRGRPIPITKNNHPTVKSTELMRYLCRLITPPGGTVLDPFMGSGSTGKAAVLEGFDFIGIEQDAEYFRIAEARINFVLKKREKQGKLVLE